MDRMRRGRTDERTDEMGSARLDLTTFVPVDSVEELEPLFERSTAEPVILFLYDPYCPINHVARAELMLVGGEAALVDVSRRHAVSREIARRTGVRHESPQAIVLRDRRPVWDASHYGITADEVRAALDEAA